MTGSRQLPRGRLGFPLKVVVAAYIAALAVLPFAHHDLLCHLKSSTHCTTCNLSSSADDTSTQPPLASAVLPDAGRAESLALTLVSSRVPDASPGRSPPTL